ncbi:thioredoxin-dependent thiol peroxidase [Rubripirellula tenax]|uniref:Thioredoxin-dependent thiol peroxidase n=1 Tax=Rubripirellula tenax TaxID=2528015 RepID=A0A5C6EM31_9BACT|nr:peroxiredoxin family protein [Rubripirellula tenax]TWU48666.1 thioredoxin-dependent thiol peroxidase [Rubripirellula tenax]
MMSVNRFRQSALTVTIVVSIGLAGCGASPSTSEPAAPATDVTAEPTQVDESIPNRKVLFHDEVTSNREDDGTLANLSFVDTNGSDVSLKQYQGKQNVLLVFTRGFNGSLCPFCTTQTSRLIANHGEFAKRDTQILLVYPGSKEQLPQFIRASNDSGNSDAFPFPVLLDEDLVAVKQLGIAAHLAFPSTFLIDIRGNVRLSYVGSSPSDRPSIKALIDQIDSLGP